MNNPIVVAIAVVLLVLVALSAQYIQKRVEAVTIAVGKATTAPDTRNVMRRRPHVISSNAAAETTVTPSDGSYQVDPALSARAAAADYITGFRFPDMFGDEETVTLEEKLGDRPSNVVGTFRVKDIKHVNAIPGVPGADTTGLEFQRIVTIEQWQGGMQYRLVNSAGVKSEANSITMYKWSQ